MLVGGWGWPFFDGGLSGGGVWLVGVEELGEWDLGYLGLDLGVWVIE